MRAATFVMFLLASTSAHAGEGEYIESVPANGFGSVSMSFGVGPVSTQANLPPGDGGIGPATIENDGWMSHARLQFARYFFETRFGSMAGIDVHADLGWFGRSAIEHDDGLEGMTNGRLFYDFGSALLVSPFHGESWRLTFVGGGALSSDVAALRVGTRLLARVAGTAVELGGELRPSRAWGGLYYQEQRGSLRLSWDERGLGIGVELWRGDASEDDGSAHRERALRGDFLVALFSVAYRK